MKIFVLSPNAKFAFTSDLENKLKSVGELAIIEKSVPLMEIPGMMEAYDKIIAYDPDFCDWKAERDELIKVPGLKAVCLQTTSFSWVDVEFLAKHNIPVINLRGFSTEAVAEWAVMMALALARKLPLVIKEGWKQDFVKYQGVELKDKVAGIIGLGNNGRRIAEICDGLGMKVVYWSKNTRDKRFGYVGLEELMKSADFVFPSLAQNAETEELITDEMLGKMKSSAIFVSTIHNIYNHDLLVRMVEDGKLFGYGFEDQPEKFNDYEGNVWAAPSLAWATDGSMKRNAEQWVDSIVKASNGDFENRVN